MILCYRHNVSYRACPTRWGCAWRQGASRCAWWLIQQTTRDRRRTT